MFVAIGLSGVNSVILAGLIYIYAKISIKTRASYSAGLVVFSALLMLHDLLTVYAYGTMSPLFGSEALPYLSAIGAAELGGLLILLKITI